MLNKSKNIIKLALLIAGITMGVSQAMESKDAPIWKTKVITGDYAFTRGSIDAYRGTTLNEAAWNKVVNYFLEHPTSIKNLAGRAVGIHPTLTEETLRKEIERWEAKQAGLIGSIAELQGQPQSDSTNAKIQDMMDQVEDITKYLNILRSRHEIIKSIIESATN